MTRIISFSDGFTSSTAPIIAGSSTQENFIIANSATATSLMTIDSVTYKSAFFDYTLKRADVSDSFIQNGKGIMGFDGSSWSITFGNFQNDDLVVDTAPVAEQVYFYMTTSLGIGSLVYDSGTMSGTYSGSLSLSIIRITV